MIRLIAGRACCLTRYEIIVDKLHIHETRLVRATPMPQQLGIGHKRGQNQPI